MTLPRFAVSINGTAVDNPGSEYPLLVYRDVTYFPMTSTYCHALGLAVQWNDVRGLAICTLPNRSPLGEVEAATQPNDAAFYTAETANYLTRLNGRRIDEAEADYPLLNFRGVTYFPLTWDYCYHEFGLDLTFSAASGLALDTMESREHLSIDRNAPSRGGWMILGGSDGSSYAFSPFGELMAQAEAVRGDAPTTYVTRPQFSAMPDAALTYSGNDLYYGAQYVTTRADGAMPAAYAWADDTLRVIAVELEGSVAVLAEDTAQTRCRLLGTFSDFPEIHPAAQGYYIGGGGQLVYWKGGATTPLNRALGYSMIEPIGFRNGHLYLRAQLLDQEVQPLYDGYFALNESDLAIQEICPYVSGSAFLTEDGGLYCCPDYQASVIDLRTGDRIWR